MSTLASKVQEVFNEPGCGKNQAKSDKERKKGCTKQLTPGAAAGGCAFDGAKIALQPITDVAHLVHGPIACEGNSWDNRDAKSSGSQALSHRLHHRHQRDSTSSTAARSGCSGRSARSSRNTIRPRCSSTRPASPAMIGDDIEAVCKKAAEKFGKPVIPVNAPGFVGTKNLGNKLAGEALLDYVIGTEEPELHHALRHQHHRRIQPGRRAVAGEAAVRRARHPHPRLHLRRLRATTRSPARIAPGPR